MGGYTATAVLTSLIGVTTAAWQVAILRTGGWMARGLRVPSRNALLADVVPAAAYGARGRERLKRERHERSLARPHAPANAAEEERVMRRFQEAWAAVDIDGIVALLTDDAPLTMPPEAQRFESSAQVGTFFATAPLDGRLDRIQLVPTRANRQPALAAYADERGEGVFEAYGVMVFAIRGDRIDGITGFARQPALFTRLGLPTRLAATANRGG